MSIKPDRLTVRLTWYGRVLDGPLKKRVKAGEACWSLDTTDVDIAQMKQAPKHDRDNNTTGPSANSGAASGTGVVQMTELLLILPKEEAGRYWRGLFDGGDEKSHLQVSISGLLQDAFIVQGRTDSVTFTAGHDVLLSCISYIRTCCWLAYLPIRQLNSYH